MFFFYQAEPETPWEVALASERASIEAKGVAFTTVLDVDNSFSQTTSADEVASAKYAAPKGFYCDFDSDDVTEVLNQARVWLLKLTQEQEFDITQARLYFTGGRGCHIEIPLECFLPKIPPTGIQHLPAIFKEIAMSTYVDTLDMRVYSAKRGRMWRVPNVKRDNGLHKVQVSVDEFLEADAEDYDRICSSPRAPLPLNPATLNPKMSLLYQLSKEKVEGGIKRRRSNKKSADIALKFEGKWPASFQLILQGKGINPDLGWNQVAMQTASFALALGKTEEEMLAEAEGLIANHEGDSNRYGTDFKRRRELINQYRYQQDNPGYEFSVGGIKTLYGPGVSTIDIDWAGAEVEDDEEEEDDSTPEPQTEEEIDEAARKANEETLERVGLMYSRKGIFMKTESGPVKVCSTGFAKPMRLAKITDGSVVGYEVEVVVDGVSQGRAILPMSAMTSKSSLTSWLSTYSTSISAPETVVPQLADLFRVKTHGVTMLTVSKEGVDVVTPPTLPGVKEQRPTEIIFSTPDEVYSMLGTPLKFRGANDPNGTFKSDLWHSPELEDTPETRKYIDNLLAINAPKTLAPVLGWFTAAFMCQPIRKVFGQFPILHVFGQAGSGKTKTMQLLNCMHYYRHEAKELSAVGSTFFPLMAAVTQSASIPVFLDEYKPRQMSAHQKNMLLNIFRNNYAGMDIERGAISKDSGSSSTVINSFSNVAPILFIAEAVETETAIIERSVVTTFSKEGRAGRREEFDYCFDYRQGGVLSALGKSIAQIVLASDVGTLGELVRKNRKILETGIDDRVADDATRQIFNSAVVMGGLELLKSTLRTVFGDTYDERIDNLLAAISEFDTSDRIVSLPEAAKVLDVMAQMVRSDNDQFRLIEGRDYITDGTFVDIDVKAAYLKYAAHQRAHGQEVLYDSSDAAVAGLKGYHACINSARGLPSEIRKTMFQAIQRFSCEDMARDGIESFFEIS